MDRRETLSALVALGASARPLRVIAQPRGKVQRVAWLSIGEIGETGKAAFVRGLAAHGRSFPQ